MWEARLGFDIHTHGFAAACHPGCLTRTDGRRLQVAALETLFEDRTQGFHVQKTMDGMPGVNGSTQLSGARLLHYSFQRQKLGQALYEFASSLDEFVRQLQVWGTLEYAHLPSYTLDSFALVLEVFEGSHTAPKGVLVEPRAGEKSLGMHSVHVTGFEDSGETILFVNSWGATWGDRGHGAVSREYLKRYFHQALTSRPAAHGPTALKDKLWEHDVTSQKFRSLWLVQNPIWSRRISSDVGNLRLRLYESISPEHGTIVDCIEVRNGYGLRLGWAFVNHRKNDKDTGRFSEIIEIFCWPAFRRLGIGRLLEETAVYRARIAGSASISVLMHEADAIVGSPRAAARLFGKVMGYEWRWRATTGLRLAAVGFKNL
jgi:hypothetical protein